MARRKAEQSGGNSTSPSSVNTRASTSRLSSFQGSLKSTPPTSDEGEEDNHLKTNPPRRVTRASLSKDTTRKRARDADSEDIDGADNESGKMQGGSVKRRVVNKTAYVEIQKKTLTRLKSGQKVRYLSVLPGAFS